MIQYEIRLIYTNKFIVSLIKRKKQWCEHNIIFNKNKKISNDIFKVDLITRQKQVRKYLENGKGNFRILVSIHNTHTTHNFIKTISR